MRRGLPWATRGTSWAFMEKFEIPDLDHPELNYLTRWRLVQTPWFGIFVHRMDGPDARPTLHDHPYSFVSFVLKGGYREQRLDTRTRDEFMHDIRHVNVMRRDDAHYIYKLLRVPTWTLLFVGARRRTWGYLWQSWLDESTWLWSSFDEHPYNLEFEKAMERRKALR